MTRRWLLRLAGPVLVAGTVLAVMTVGQGREVNLAYLAAVTVMSAMLLWLVADIVPVVPYVSWSVTGTYVPRQPGPDARLARLTERLGSNIHRDTVGADIHQILTTVVDDRLLRGHGIDRKTDPAAAAAVLGPELTAYLDSDPRGNRSAAHRRLGALLTRIEEL